MPSLWQRLRSPKQADTDTQSRSEAEVSLEQFVNNFMYNGLNYPFFGTNSIGQKIEEPRSSFTSYVNELYRFHPIIFSLINRRAAVFSEARFKFRRLQDGRPGELFGTEALSVLEHPAPNVTTGGLLYHAIQDVDLSGNFYAVRDGEYIRRLRPDWVTIVLGSNVNPDEATLQYDAIPIGYIYKPGNQGNPQYFLAEEVAHFAPIPDPLACYRGMSWVTPIIREAMGDTLATEHKIKYLEQGATPNMVVTLGENVTNREEFTRWVEAFEDAHGGISNAFKTLYLAAGTTANVVGTDLKNADFKAVTSQGENRIAVAAGVPGIIAGLSEGLEASTYSNFTQARRSFTDGTIWPLWREIAGSLEKLVDVPAGAELWIDTRDIAYLQEDAKNRAEVGHLEAQSLKFLLEGGFTAESAKEAIQAQDWGRLEHSGLISVQLHKDEAIEDGEEVEDEEVQPPQPNPPKDPTIS